MEEATVILEPLATVADLNAIVTTPIDDTEKVQNLLRSASDAVRDSAGGPISQMTSIVTAFGYGAEAWLSLPVYLVTDVASVTIGGVEVRGWTLANGRLHRSGGWGSVSDSGRPIPVEVECTHGYQVIPTPVRDLVVQLVLAALHQIEEAGMIGHVPGIRQESISANAYAVTYGSDDPVPSTVFEIPDRTRRWLRSTYGSGSASVVTVR